MRKVCRNCDRLKSHTEFYPDGAKNDGIRCYCKECDNELRAARGYKNRPTSPTVLASRAEKRAERARKRAEKASSGVYFLLCMPTGDIYYGSTKSLGRRRIEHFSKIRNHIHGNRKIRELSQQYGVEDFKFEIIRVCNMEESERLEKILIKANPGCCNWAHKRRANG